MSSSVLYEAAEHGRELLKKMANTGLSKCSTVLSKYSMMMSKYSTAMSKYSTVQSKYSSLSLDNYLFV